MCETHALYRRRGHPARQRSGSYVLRLAVGNERTTDADVERAWEVLRREAR